MSSNKRQKSEEEEVAFVYTGSVEVPENATKVIIDASVTEIPRAFLHCQKQLKEAVLNEGLQKVGDFAFWGCVSLTRIEVPSSVTEIGCSAFYGCTNLREVVLNEGLQKTWGGAYEECKSLSNIKLPLTLIEFGYSAFNNCTNLSGVVFNEGLQKIGNSAFRFCTSLANIKLPSTVTKIGAGAFNRCTNLREVVLNEGLQEIEYAAFGECQSLEYLKFSSISNRVKMLIDTGITEIEDKLTANQYFEWRGGEFLVHHEATSSENWKATRTNFDRVLAWIFFYELREATATIALAHWKIKIEETGAATVEERDACRCEIPGPAKDAIIQYLQVDIGVDYNESDDSSQFSDSSSEDESGDY